MLFAQQPAEAERQEEKTVSLEEEGEPFSWKPTALRLGVDISRLTLSLLEKDARFFEANGDLQFGRYLLAAELGTGRQQRNYLDQLAYQVRGTYFRLGADINLIPENKENNVLFVGLRYGRSSYAEQLYTTYTDPVFSTTDAVQGSFPVEIEDREANARWFEGVAGMKARVWKGFFLGYTLRYKLALKTNGTASFASYEVPGFGKVGDGNTFAFNYHIFYRIPFK